MSGLICMWLGGFLAATCYEMNDPTMDSHAKSFAAAMLWPIVALVALWIAIDKWVRP
ncbi:MAG TPA: hypothetical protein VK681_39175 [Reyranella sp.]|nr:hypothetical protein [Reyranella sp.]